MQAPASSASAPVPGCRRKVVVLVVKAHVEGDDIEGAIVTVCLLVLVQREIVSLDPPCTQGMKALPRKRNSTATLCVT